MRQFQGEKQQQASAGLSNRLWLESFTSCFFGLAAGNTCYEFFFFSFFTEGGVDWRHVIERFIDWKGGRG